MFFYILLLLSIIALGITLNFIKILPYKNEVFLIISGLILIIISSIRYDVGFDYSYIYAPMYQELLSTNVEDIFKLRHEKGFLLLECIISLFTKNYQAIFLGTSILIIVLFFIYFKKYSENVLISVFLFITWGYFYCSMNFIRQTIAGGIVLFAIQSVKQKKLFRYILIILLASTFHKSALIMLPFYFILQIKITKNILTLYGIITAFIMLTSNYIISFGIKHFFPWYDLSDNIHITESSPWYNMIFPTIIFVSLFYFSDIITKNDKTNNIYISCGFFSAFFVLLSLKHSILDRFSLYFDPVLLIVIPLMVGKLKDELLWNKNKYNLSNPFDKIRYKIARGIPIIIITLSLVHNVFILYMDSACVVPYKTIFSQPFYTPYVESLKQPPHV